MLVVMVDEDMCENFCNSNKQFHPADRDIKSEKAVFGFKSYDKQHHV